MRCTECASNCGGDITGDGKDKHIFGQMPQKNKCTLVRSDLKMIDSMKTYGNNNKVSEHMKCIAEMRVLYYEGDGPSMLLVTLRQS